MTSNQKGGIGQGHDRDRPPHRHRPDADGRPRATKAVRIYA